MLTMVEYVHQRILSYPQGLIAVDMTMGNGHDTLFLSQHCQYVYAFDIQQEAIDITSKRLKDQHNVCYILDNHAHFDQYIQTFDIAVFNLGYLPKADHHMTTQLSSTKIAIEKTVKMMKVALWIVVYPGHEEGKRESQWINQYVSQLDTHAYNVSCYQMMNKKKSPYVIEIEKKTK